MESINDQEVIYKLSLLEQRVQEISQQLEAVKNGISELNELEKGLSEITGAKGKEILAQIGRGIFVRAKVLSEDLIVDIGEKNFVKKNVSGTKDTIKEQIKKLESVQEELEMNLERTKTEFSEIVNKYEER